MAYSVQKLPHEPIVYVDLPADFDVKTETDAVIADIVQMLDQQEEAVYYIPNLLEANWNLSEMMTATNRATQGENAFFYHPNIREFLFVATSLQWHKMVELFRSEVFDSLQIRLFPTVDDALAYVRARN